MRIIDLFEHAVLDEGRDAPLYHGTHFANAISILEKDAMLANTFHVPSIGNVMRATISGVSLSRDFAVSASFGPVVFVLDQAKLVRNARLMPIDFWEKSKNRRSYSTAEAEEFHVGPLKNVSRYLMEIRVRGTWLDMAAWTKQHRIIPRLNRPKDPDAYHLLAEHPLLRIVDKWPRA